MHYISFLSVKYILNESVHLYVCICLYTQVFLYRVSTNTYRHTTGPTAIAQEWVRNKEVWLEKFSQVIPQEPVFLEWLLPSPLFSTTWGKEVSAFCKGQLWLHRLINTLVLMCSLLSHVQLFVILWTVAKQAPLSMEFSRKEYWSWLQFPPPGDLLNPETETVSLISLALAGRFFTTSTTYRFPQRALSLMPTEGKTYYIRKGFFGIKLRIIDNLKILFFKEIQVKHLSIGMDDRNDSWTIYCIKHYMHFGLNFVSWISSENYIIFKKHHKKRT